MMSYAPRYEYCDPAASIITRFGGIDQVAGFTALDRTTVYKWLRKPPKGTGGWIPRSHHKMFVKEAERRGMDVDETEFVHSQAA